MSPHLVAWAHTGCGCRRDTDPAFFLACDLHLHAEKLLHGCQMALPLLPEGEAKEYLEAVLARLPDA